ncbi:hypothetical protein PHLCEN_2v2051 [Hermanssonia centrifuga]|uniref:ATP synthase mitochondrial F1 complex assembly factor 2 n=1 Tax=Hermanssonia centrifuga TaxID=98765 RepID=A0A2R6RQ69_9APHY|nr:hypothetical protein PHLCEN_2v2051 [Hermanssonia centrifuga]
MQSIGARCILTSLRRLPATIPPYYFRVQCSIRSQATVATSGPAVTATNRAEATLKRFWKTVGVEPRGDAFAITLDKRPLKTPSGNPLVLPKTKPLAATLIAAEWENQETLLKQHSLPMTSLASRAIDAFKDDEAKKEVRRQLLEYLKTDTIWYVAFPKTCLLLPQHSVRSFHSPEPDTLVKLQKVHWEPLLDWARSEYGVEIRTTDSFVLNPQPDETLQKFDEVLTKFNSWELAAMERATYTSKSFLIALALTLRKITAEQAAQASHVEVNSQIEKWGEVEDYTKNSKQRDIHSEKTAVFSID